jgi:hypothetical protein
MYFEKLALLIGLAAMYGLIAVDNRFGYRSPQSVGVTVEETAALWRKVLVRWNDHVRYGGLFLFAMGLSAFGVLVRRNPSSSKLVPIVIAGIGVLIYAYGLAWRWFVTVRDNKVS